MSRQRIILEMGTGNDLYGEDYTKAANRAVQDALHHSSIGIFRSLGLDHADMEVTVTLGVQEPEKVNKDAVAATLPHGKITVNTVKGGLNIEDSQQNRKTVIATAGIEAWLEIPEKWQQNRS